MAQVSGGGGSRFNGGTITQTLTVDPPSGSKGVVVAGVDADTTKLLDLSAVHTVFNVDSDGTVLYTSDDTPLLHVEGTGGTPALLQVDDDSNRHRILARTDNTNGLKVFYGGAEVFVARGNSATGRGYLRRNPDNPATAALASGTGTQFDVNSDRDTYTPITTDGTNNAATCAVAVSPDNITYTALYTLTLPAALNNLGAEIAPVSVFVPGSWYLRLTVAHATIGTTTYY